MTPFYQDTLVASLVLAFAPPANLGRQSLASPTASRSGQTGALLSWLEVRDATNRPVPFLGAQRGGAHKLLGAERTRFARRV